MSSSHDRSHEWREWHLTPHGWVAGSEQWDFARPDIVDPPPDRVLTRSYHERISSGFMEMDLYSEESWRSPDAALVGRLLAQHGDHPLAKYTKYREG